MTRSLDVARADQRWHRLHSPLGDLTNFAEAVFLHDGADRFFTDHTQIQVATVAHLRASAPARLTANAPAAPPGSPGATLAGSNACGATTTGTSAADERSVEARRLSGGTSGASAREGTGEAPEAGADDGGESSPAEPASRAGAQLIGYGMGEAPLAMDLTRLLPSQEDDEARWHEVVAHLNQRSTSFRRLWAGLKVSHRVHSDYEVRHPAVGRLSLRRTVNPLPGGGWYDRIQPRPGSKAADMMVLLDLS